MAWRIITGSFASSEYFTNLSLGVIPGVSSVFENGGNPSVVSGSTRTIWDLGAEVPNLTYDNIGTDLYWASDDAADVGISVLSFGLDNDWLQQQTTTVTNGLTPVLAGNFLRSFSSLVTSSSPIPQGNLYLFTLGSFVAGSIVDPSGIRSKIPLSSIAGDSGTDFQSDNSTHNGFYTVPADSSLIIDRITGSLSGNKEGRLSGHLRLFGGPFLNRNPLFVAGNNVDREFKGNPAIPPKSDLQFRATTDSGSGASAFITLIGRLYKNG